MTERYLAALGKVIHQKRVSLSLSQEELGRMAGLNRTYIGDIEKGARNPSVTVLHNLASALGMSLSSLSKIAEEVAQASSGDPIPDADAETRNEYAMTIFALKEQINEMERQYAKLEKDNQQLQRLNRDQVLILDAIPAMIWLKDKSNKILGANDRAARASGLTKQEMVGKSTYDLYPELANKYYRDDMEVVNTGRPKFGIIEPHVPGNQVHQETVWVRTDKFPYYNEKGEIIGVIVFAVDVTEFQATHDALLETQKNMGKLLAQIQKPTQAGTS